MTPTKLCPVPQEKRFGPKLLEEGKQQYHLFVQMMYGDGSRNGYNTFSITYLEYQKTEYGTWKLESCGTNPEKIAEHFPELAQYVKYHLVSTDGPLHYIANTMYHVQKGNLDYARSTAVWPEATDEDLQIPQEELKKKLQERLGGLMRGFRDAVETLGFVY